MFTYAQVKEFWNNYLKNSEQFFKDWQKDVLDTLKSDFTTNQIYGLTAIYENSSNRKEIWVNGILDVSTNTNGNLYNSTENTLIGTDSRIIGILPGNIYNYKIYNRALSASEILQNYNAQKGRFGL